MTTREGGATLNTCTVLRWSTLQGGSENDMNECCPVSGEAEQEPGRACKRAALDRKSVV